MAGYKKGFTTYDAFSAVEKQVKKDFIRQGWKLESVSLYDYYMRAGEITGATIHVGIIPWWSDEHRDGTTNVTGKRKEYDYKVALSEDGQIVVERSDYDYNKTAEADNG